ncbi:hypothetical protein NBRC116188_25270 [Oceaniserpentilla sp. 4NH20-0058]|uniref:hypothetical protein n=1 Tax=Oceaniserpentilla sp. 4NH20-0058 TaxID=3127660 RepID=UPI003109094E
MEIAKLLFIFAPIVFWFLYAIYLMLRANYRRESNLCHHCGCHLSEGNKNTDDFVDGYGSSYSRFSCNDCVGKKFTFTKWLWPIAGWQNNSDTHYSGIK